MNAEVDGIYGDFHICEYCAYFCEFCAYYQDGPQCMKDDEVPCKGREDRCDGWSPRWYAAHHCLLNLIRKEAAEQCKTTQS